MSNSTNNTSAIVERDSYYGHSYLLPVRYVNDFMASEDDRFAVLATMGITREHGDSPLVAWRNACQDYSGIDRRPVFTTCAFPVHKSGNSLSTSPSRLRGAQISPVWAPR